MTRTENGAALLDELRSTLTTYVVMPTEYAADAVTLWIAATHSVSALTHATRLVIRSPEKRCGKSRLLDVIAGTCANPLMTVNATTAAIFRSIGAGEQPPTLLLDEADTVFGSKKVAEANEDLRGLLNAGYQRGRPMLRCVGPMSTPQAFDTFAMAALAGIGSMPDTIEDRAVIISMRRRAPGESVKPYRERRDGPQLEAVRDRLGAWAIRTLADLTDAEPLLPLEDRAADTWEPLVAVADLAGGSWPARARAAAVAMQAEADASDVEASLGVRLLEDCRQVLSDVPYLASDDLVDRLKEIGEAPWHAFALTARDLAWRLKGYGIKPDRIPRGSGGKQARGYRTEDFLDAWARYLSPAASLPVTPSFVQVNPVTDPGAVTDEAVTGPSSVTHLTCGNDAVTVDDGHRREPACADCDEPLSEADQLVGSSFCSSCDPATLSSHA